MIRLAQPQYDFQECLDACVLGIAANNNLKQKLESDRDSVISEGQRYLVSSGAGELYLIGAVDFSENLNPKVIGELTKSDLVKVYEQYFVPRAKPARYIYDALLNAAKESCPFCGGIGTPRNLDHFLPKSHFPQFSILPNNLVPSCRDCNMDGKASAYALSAEDQIIQPYIDKDIFFSEQWIFATYHDAPVGEPGKFEYFVRVPEGWNEVDGLRVYKHFQDFSLGRRYAVKAAESLGTIMLQVNKLRGLGLGARIIRETLLDPGVEAAHFPNHWQCGLYQALIEYYSEV